MEKNPHYLQYLQILREELLPAMGCTEPIAIALAAAKARELLGCLPEQVELEVSGNIIKNVKSVTVPNTNGLKGMEAAAAAGIVAGRAELALTLVSAAKIIQKHTVFFIHARVSTCQDLATCCHISIQFLF